VRLIYGGSLLAFIGILNELSSVTKVIASSKSAKLAAENATTISRLMPGAISPVVSFGYLCSFMVKLSVSGGMNLILLLTPVTFVILSGI
jgi:hypothetical protein